MLFYAYLSVTVCSFGQDGQIKRQIHQMGDIQTILDTFKCVSIMAELNIMQTAGGQEQTIHAHALNLTSFFAFQRHRIFQAMARKERTKVNKKKRTHEEMIGDTDERKGVVQDLEKLVQWHEKGVLNDQEFKALKRKLIFGDNLASEANFDAKQLASSIEGAPKPKKS